MYGLLSASNNANVLVMEDLVVVVVVVDDTIEAGMVATDQVDPRS
jgi:hypothetical protein